MPRAGSGGGGGRSSGGHSSGGHSTSTHSSGGHRVGGSSSGGGSHSRAGGGSFGGSRPSGGGGRPVGGGRPIGGGGFGGPQPHRGPMTPPPPPAPRRRRGYGGYGGGGCLTSMLSGVIGLIVVIVIAISVVFSCTASGIESFVRSKPNDTSVSSVVRTKLTTSGSFDNNCVIDEIGWFDNAKSAGKSLKTFYEKTGVQPYVVLKAYDSSLTSDSAKSDYANEYYNDEIGNENSFLYMYFAEEDQDNDVGYMCYVCGHNADSVMDDEAVSVFWGKIDQYWYTDLSTDDLFEKVFSETADKIMNSSSSSSQTSSSSSGAGKVIKNIILVVIVAGIAVFIAKKLKKKEDDSSSTPTEEKDNPNMLN